MIAADERVDGAQWRSVSSLSSSNLRSVWAAGPSDVWAVGADATVLRSDGTGWRAVTHPLTGSATTTASFRAVWGAAPDEVLVGGVLHWDGRAWSQHSGVTDSVNAIWGSGSNDVWAVGGHTQRGGSIARWTGGPAWTPLSSGTNNGLNAVWGSGPSDVWIVGNAGTILHWTGAALEQTAASDRITTADLQGVWGSGPTDVWAAGNDVMLHWDGAAWKAMPAQGKVLALWGTGPNDVWGAGGFAGEGFVVRWDGSKWSKAFAAGFLGAALEGIWASAPGEVWSVGEAGAIVTLR